MATLKDLANRMRTLEKDLPEALNQRKIYAGVELVRNLAHTTPVDTSEALSNWQAEPGEPNWLHLPPHYSGVFGSTREASAVWAVEVAKKDLAETKPGQPIHVFNNAPHIRKLNDGYSMQAPRGFVYSEVMRVRLMLRFMPFTMEVKNV